LEFKDSLWVYLLLNWSGIGGKVLRLDTKTSLVSIPSLLGFSKMSPTSFLAFMGSARLSSDSFGSLAAASELLADWSSVRDIFGVLLGGEVEAALS
jgi:hypothetical protein